jgi:hypothetical protein
MSNYEPANGRSLSSPTPEILQAPGLINRSSIGGYGSTSLSTHLANPETVESAGGGSGLSRYVHALRRRWLISMLIALPLAAGAAYAAWVL